MAGKTKAFYSIAVAFLVLHGFAQAFAICWLFRMQEGLTKLFEVPVVVELSKLPNQPSI